MRGQLAYRITLSFLLASLGPILLVGLAAWGKLRAELVGEIERTHRNLIEQAELDLREEFDSYRKQLSRLGKQVEVQRMTEDHLQPALDSFLDYNDLFHQVLVFDAAGKYIAGSARGRWTSAAPTGITSLPVALAQPCRDALERGRETLTAPVSGEPGQVHLYAVAPVRPFVDQAKPLGVIVADLRLYGAEIQSVIEGWEFVGQTYLYITDPEGRVLARAGRGFPGHLRTISVPIATAAAAVTAKPGEKPEMVSGIATLCGREDLIATSSLPALGVCVVVGKPYAEVSRFLTDLAGSLGLYVLIGVLAALTFGVVLSRRLASPILALAAGIRRVANGEVAHRVPVAGEDELSEAGVAFNAMASRLQRVGLVEDLWHARKSARASSETK